MKTVTFYADSNRSDNLLHVETDGCIVNIHVGLTDSEGRKVTAVSISPDDESRGGDGQSRMWYLADDNSNGSLRVIRKHRYLAKISEPEPRTLSDADATREFSRAVEAWSWLGDERREQEDATGDTENEHDDDAPYSEVVDKLDGRATAAVDGRSDLIIGTVHGHTPGWNRDDGPDSGLNYSVEILED